MPFTELGPPKTGQGTASVWGLSRQSWISLSCMRLPWFEAPDKHRPCFRINANLLDISLPRRGALSPGPKLGYFPLSSCSPNWDDKNYPKGSPRMRSHQVPILRCNTGSLPADGIDLRSENMDGNHGSSDHCSHSGRVACAVWGVMLGFESAALNDMLPQACQGSYEGLVSGISGSSSKLLAPCWLKHE